MKYGLNLPNGGLEPRLMSEFATLAEQAGWDGVFLEDYIVWQGDQETTTYDPWIILAAMALRTERIRLGTLVTPLARRRPWKVAKELVTLDHLSGGRMILGVGLGDNISSDYSFQPFGEEMNLKRRAGLLDESLEILNGLWSGESFSYQGKYYQVTQVQLLPKPLQSPRIPIWVGGAYPNKGPLRRAARWDGACFYKLHSHSMDPEDVKNLRAFVESLRGSGVTYDIVVGGSSRRADWEEEREYIRSLAEAGMTWWIEYVPPDDIEAMEACVLRSPLRVD